MSNEEMFLPFYLHLKMTGVIENVRELTDWANLIVGQYMFMYNENDNFYYKHFATRDYVVITSKGKLKEGYIENPDNF